MLTQVARTGSRELFTLCVLAVALGVAFGAAELFGVSFALGAFFAGMVLHESDLSRQSGGKPAAIAGRICGIVLRLGRDALDPLIIVREPLIVAAVLLLIVIGKSLVALAIVLASGYPLSTAPPSPPRWLRSANSPSFSPGSASPTVCWRERASTSFLLVRSSPSRSIRWFSRPLIASIRRVHSNPQLRQFEDARGTRFSRLKKDLDSARRQAQEKAAAHKTFTPEELADRFPLFEGLTPEQREVVLLHFEPRTAQPGERIIRAGDKADAVYFMVDGRVEVAVGNRRIKLGPGDFFGEMALISGLPRAADVTALDYSKFATLSRRDFRQFLARYPAIRHRIATLANKRREMNRHLAGENA